MADANLNVDALHPRSDCSRENEPPATPNGASTPTAAVRYMDDETFRESLDEVVADHGRLLAKLAE